MKLAGQSAPDWESRFGLLFAHCLNGWAGLGRLLGRQHDKALIGIPNLRPAEGKIRPVHLLPQQQPMWATYTYVKEALKTQSPALVVVEFRMAFSDQEYFAEKDTF